MLGKWGRAGDQELKISANQLPESTVDLPSSGDNRAAIVQISTPYTADLITKGVTLEAEEDNIQNGVSTP